MEGPTIADPQPLCLYWVTMGVVSSVATLLVVLFCFVADISCCSDICFADADFYSLAHSAYTFVQRDPVDQQDCMSSIFGRSQLSFAIG